MLAEEVLADCTLLRTPGADRSEERCSLSQADGRVLVRWLEVVGKLGNWLVEVGTGSCLVVRIVREEDMKGTLAVLAEGRLELAVARRLGEGVGYAAPISLFIYTYIWMGRTCKTEGSTIFMSSIAWNSA